MLGKLIFKKHMLTKQESITSKKLGSLNCWRIANSIINKGKPALPPNFNGPGSWSMTSDKIVC